MGSVHRAWLGWAAMCVGAGGWELSISRSEPRSTAPVQLDKTFKAVSRFRPNRSRWSQTGGASVFGVREQSRSS